MLDVDTATDTDTDGQGTSSPSDKSEPEAGYRRGSGGFVVRTHKYVPPLTAALGDNDVGVGGAKADTVFAMADAATDGSSIGDETKAKVSVSRRRSGSGSGGFVVRSHRNVAPLSSQVRKDITRVVSASFRSLLWGLGMRGSVSSLLRRGLHASELLAHNGCCAVLLPKWAS